VIVIVTITNYNVLNNPIVGIRSLVGPNVPDNLVNVGQR